MGRFSRAAALSILTAIFAGMPTPLRAIDPAIGTGNELLTTCAEENGWSAGYCHGFILGVYRGLLLVTSNDPIICPGERVTVGQARRIVIAYMDNNPKTLDQAAEYLVTTAFMDAWPCQKGK